MQHVQEFETGTLDRIERECAIRMQRAGVRYRPREATPPSAFVAVETAVLVMVAALAMTTIIVTAGGPDPDLQQATAGTVEAARPVPASHADEGTRHATLQIAR